MFEQIAIEDISHKNCGKPGALLSRSGRRFGARSNVCLIEAKGIAPSAGRAAPQAPAIILRPDPAGARPSAARAEGDGVPAGQVQEQRPRIISMQGRGDHFERRSGPAGFEARADRLRVEVAPDEDHA